MKSKVGYVNFFVVPVPKSKLAQYRRMMKVFAKVFIELGASSYYECVGDKLERGSVTSFPRSVKLKKGEVVVLGYQTYKSKAQCDKVMERAMSDVRLAPYMNPEKMIFDGMRMYWGGFKPIIRF